MATPSPTFRKRGSRRDGGSWDTATINAVFTKARYYNGRYYDTCGAVIERAQYGVTTENGTGWEIDHIVPVAKGGGDELSNLQPLQWQNNRAKGEGPLACVVKAAS